MKLIIINGPPGSGKSSVAEALHKISPPLSFLLKFDAQRRFLKDRHEHILEAEAITYKVCRAIAATCLQEGKDVIFERVISDATVLDNFTELGKEHGAEVYEFILWADKETILHRNITREAPADGLPDTRRVDTETAEKFWNKVNLIKDQRSNAYVLDVRKYSLDQVIDQVKGILKI